jgi:hypothetical protein
MIMKLFVLSFTSEGALHFSAKGDGDVCQHVVVLAPDEKSAREMASSLDDGAAKERMELNDETINPWLEAKYISCEEHSLNEQGVVFASITDYVPT